MRNKLKIVFLDFDDIRNPLLGAGQARATVEVGKRLAKKGHEVTVFCSRYPGYKDRIENGIVYKHIGLGSGNIKLNNLIYILTTPFYVRNIKADIIVECFTAPISTLFSPLFTKIPIVALPTSFEAERFSKLYHLPFDKIEKFGLRFYKYFLPYSDYLDQKMKKINPKVISKIVPEGVGNEFFNIRQKSPKHILFLGRLDIGQKGINHLLNAYSQIKNKIKYPLIIAGNGPDEKKVQQLIKMLDLEGQVKMIGPTFGDIKMKVLSETAFVVMPSVHETFSCFALEALASGCPLITFEIPGLAWTEKSVSLKTKAFDIKEYAKMILKAAEKETLERMRKNTRAFAKKFSWDKVASSFELFSYQVLKKEGRLNNV